ncbi:MAG: GlsB/YeaQ/YmgE family stress response membrane protein [Acidobacteriota bacterium]
MFGLVGWMIFGLLVGAVAKLMMPGRDPGGFIITMLIGMAGAAVGGWLGRSFGMYGPAEPAGFLMALVGAVSLLLIYRMVAGRSVA